VVWKGQTGPFHYSHDVSTCLTQSPQSNITYLAFRLSTFVSILAHVVFEARLNSPQTMLTKQFTAVENMLPCFGILGRVVRKTMGPRHHANKLTSANWIPVRDVGVVDLEAIDEVLEC
jgi:hypothetical protein